MATDFFKGDSLAITMTIRNPSTGNPIDVDNELSGIVAYFSTETNVVVQKFSRDEYNDYKEIASLGNGQIRIIIEPEQTKDIVGSNGILTVKLQKTNGLFENGLAYKCFKVDLTKFFDIILKNEMGF